MKTLHIVRSEPTPMILQFIQATSNNGENELFMLFKEDIDYDRLMNEIFSSDRIICWW